MAHRKGVQQLTRRYGKLTLRCFSDCNLSMYIHTSTAMLPHLKQSEEVCAVTRAWLMEYFPPTRMSRTSICQPHQDPLLLDPKQNTVVDASKATNTMHSCLPTINPRSQHNNNKPSFTTQSFKNPTLALLCAPGRLCHKTSRHIVRATPTPISKQIIIRPHFFSESVQKTTIQWSQTPRQMAIPQKYKLGTKGPFS